MPDFAIEFKRLNAQQQQAVEAIDGPVLVIAGPGTGKTQLLSMRAAHILRQTDVLPGNILCLTFTESAATEMRKRLIGLMGPEGNRVAVHTFHSFGSDIITNNPEYFHNGARFHPTDELSSYETLRAIFETLPHSNPLAKTMNGEFTALADAKRAISHLKRAGLAPHELVQLLRQTDAFCEQAEPLLQTVFAERLSKQSLAAAAALVPRLAAFATPGLFGYKNLAEVCAASLAAAAETAQATGKTTTLTTWRNSWCEKNQLGELVFKNRKRGKKLHALAHVYQKYTKALEEQEGFDFDDMVSLVARTLETTPELRLNLQEQYQYIMVDEFQDTNGAQSRLLATLTDNPVHEGRPNILAVGDDDQAIYSFQGAELSNILEFTNRYREPKLVVLTENYRSTPPILQQARTVIDQAEQRLERTLPHLHKQLNSHSTATPQPVALHHFATAEHECHWVVEQVAAAVQKGVPLSDIAIIARTHKQLVELVPYLHAAGLPLNYERRNNVLHSPHIRELITLAAVVVYLSEQRFDVVEELLPELLSYNFWGIKTTDLWQLSLNAFTQRRMWLELMLQQKTGPLHAIAEFLVITSHQSLHEPCEIMLDRLIGNLEDQAPQDEQADNTAGQPPKTEGFVSPYRAFYFNQDRLHANPTAYLTLLSNLRALRQAIVGHHADADLSLRDFVDFTELCDRTNTPVLDTGQSHEATEGLNLMTAHKAKGLEFHTVFVLHVQDDTWGRKTRSARSSLSFPENLPIEPAGGRYDEALRLFFVAMTRAKQRLVLTHHTADPAGKSTILAEFLQDGLTPTTHAPQLQPSPHEQTLSWQARHLTLPHVQQKTLLQPLLGMYRLSPTHLNNFIDITRGGPQAFLLQNLLRFPQAMTPAQAFGQAIHHVLARAHTHLSATGDKRPVEDVLHDFELQLQQARLGEQDFNYLLEKGSDILQTFLAARYGSFMATQKAERNFAGQGVMVGEARLTGAIDLMAIDLKTKTIVVSDYKTGKSFTTWQGRTDYDKIKLHKYKQQLMFYKLLVEGSRDFAGYSVPSAQLEFVEAGTSDQPQVLELQFNAEELQAFKVLIQAVWLRIMSLDLPDVSGYEPSYKGVLAFEKDVVAKP